MNRLLIIDGHNLLFQMFFGMPARIVNQEGRAIHGTLGFVGALLKIIRRTDPTHLVVLFDGEHENNRVELDPQYKSNRTDYSQSPQEENPFSQLADIYAALDFMQIRHTETTIFEADDVIASYALTYGKQINIVIASYDSDFFQLISDRVCVLRYRGDKTVLCDQSYIQNKFGITPDQYADFKALTGDSADHIRGADKIGPKTAAWLLYQYGTLDHILKNAGQITRPSIRDSVIRNADRLKINQTLIRLNKKAKIPIDLRDLIYQDSGLRTTDILSAIGLR